MRETRILVVDDDMNTLSKIYIELLLQSFIVEVTNDATEILERSRRFKPDLLILNNDLPDFDAHEVCTIVKKAQKTPIILLVEKNSSKTVKIDSCSADDIYTKPVDIHELNKRIEQVLATAQP